MTAIAHHVHLHLAGSAAGIDLFGRAGAGMLDREAGELAHDIRTELLQERRQLRQIAERLDVGESMLLTNGARLGERLGRLKPNGSLLRRTPLTDLVELEIMRDAVAGKKAGWEALHAVADRYEVLDADELQGLIDQALEQERLLAAAHHRAASRALAPE